jgi:U32 family peptidase
MAKNYIPELLAPAGSIDALKAAVNAGADAVYISGKKFGARKFATNFTDLEIEEGLEYAKLMGVKIYVTVNTLVNDSQLLSVAEYLLWLYKIGIDAVIIQDLGVASIAKKIVPDLDMHASTQMTIHNVPGVKWASKFGFKRVVLSRELGILEVEEIIKETRDLGIEIEIFGHGALCYSYSGQCLLSSFIGGRSGNKGMCAQPCRKRYVLLSGKIDKYGKPLALHPIDINDKYLLSTRDLALYQNLDMISKINLNSLKIEGRMRSPEYVALVVNIYRKALDSISIGNWKQNSEDISKLKLAFNREFTGGYLIENSSELVMARDSPGNRGLYIGQVQRYDEKIRTAIIIIKNKYKLEIGDGVVFKYFHGNYETYGMAIEKSPLYKEDKLILKVGMPVKTGSKLYLTRSISLNHEAIKIIKDRPNPSIPIDIVMWWDNDLKAHLEGEFIGFHENKCKIRLKSSFKMEKAINKPLNIDQIEKQLQKTGKTPFILRKVSIKYPGDLFIPLSKLNNFRREFLEKSKIELLLSYQPSQSHIQKAYERFNNTKKILTPCMEQFVEIDDNKKTLDLAVYADSLDTVKGALESGANRIYFEVPPKNLKLSCSDSKNLQSMYRGSIDESEIDRMVSVLKLVCKLCKKNRTEFIWKWPQITHQYQINQYYKILEQLSKEIQGIMIDNIGVAEEVKKIAPHLVIYGSAGLNIFNKQTVLQLIKIFNTITPSAELSKEDLRKIISSSRLDDLKTDFELIVQGNVDTIVTKDCLLSLIPGKDIINAENKFWGIQDEKKQIFPIKIDLEGRTHILNSVELCLIDHLHEISQIGINCIVVDLRTKTYDYARDMISIYKNGLEYIKRKENSGKNMNRLKSKIKIISTGGITTGNFLKGIKE